MFPQCPSRDSRGYIDAGLGYCKVGGDKIIGGKKWKTIRQSPKGPSFRSLVNKSSYHLSSAFYVLSAVHNKLMGW